MEIFSNYALFFVQNTQRVRFRSPSRHGGGGGLNGAVDCLHNRQRRGGLGRGQGVELLYPSAATSREALSDGGVGMKTTRRSQMVARALGVGVLCDMDHSGGADALLRPALSVVGTKGPKLNNNSFTLWASLICRRHSAN